MIWNIPQPTAVCDVALRDGSVAVVRRHGNPDGPRLVLGHGNGLAIDLYLPFWSLLVRDFDLMLYDIRNHGWNALGAISDHHLATFIDDQARIVEGIDRHFGAKPRVGVFHSLSALVALLQDNAFAGLVLFDPPLCDGERGHALRGIAERIASRTRGRSDRFGTPADFANRVANANVFERVLPGVPELAAATMLRPDSDGSHVLRCPPAYEAQVVDESIRFTGLVDFENIRCPVCIVAADPALTTSRLPPLGSCHAHVALERVPGTTHFLQLEKPAECVALTIAALSGLPSLETPTA